MSARQIISAAPWPLLLREISAEKPIAPEGFVIFRSLAQLLWREAAAPPHLLDHVRLVGKSRRRGICLGAVFALAEAQIMLATVLQRYSLAIESKRPVIPVGRLTIQPSYRPMFKLEKAPLP